MRKSGLAATVTAVLATIVPTVSALAVDIPGVNDAPVVTAPISIDVIEDVAAPLTGISFADDDAGSSSVTVTMSVPIGTLAATSGSGVTVSGSGTGSLTLTATIPDVNAYIAGGNVTFVTAANSTSNVALTVEIDDGGNTGTGGALTDSAGVTLVVSAVNDAPVNNVPGAQTLVVDTGLVFSAGNGNQISVSDVDAGGGAVRVTLTATNGGLTLATTTGLVFSVGSGTFDGTMTFEGSIADINTALNGLVFSPTSGYVGAASVQIITDDMGLSGSGGAQTDSDAVAISVRGVPVTSVGTLNPDGSYKVGDTLTLRVSLLDNVIVNTSGGNPTLMLDTGAIDRLAVYVSGSGTSTLLFTYTVQQSDVSPDLDATGIGALTLNGGTIRDVADVDAWLELPPIGGPNSLSGQHDLVIDGVAPTATVSLSDDELRIGETATVTFLFSEAVSGFDNADVSVSTGSLSALSAVPGGTTWTATLTPPAGATSSGTVNLSVSGVDDVAGNPGSGTAWAAFEVDTARPTATIDIDDIFGVGATGVVTFTFSEAVTGFDGDDVTVPSGQLGPITPAEAGGVVYTAVLTPSPGVAASGVISVDLAGVTDLAGNVGVGTAESPPYAVDTTAPTTTTTTTASATTTTTTVSATTTTTTTALTTDLPATGGETTTTIRLALVLLAAGAGIALAASRRTRWHRGER